MNFSIVIIMRNEEKTLPKLASSLKEFLARGGQWICCDTGSTDKSVEVAKSLGAEVHEFGDTYRIVVDSKEATYINRKFVFKGEKPVIKGGDSLFDYSSARNAAAALAKNDMVAMPDADECYTKFDLDKVNEAIANGAEQLEYNFVFSHDQYGKEAVKFMHCKFYNRKKLAWKGIVHEVLQGEARRQFLSSDIIKLEHFQNHETNRSGYLTGLALDCYRNQDNDRNSHYLARELLWTGRPRSAIREFKRHMAMMKWPAERAQSSIYIGDAYLMLKEDDKAVAAYHEAIQIDPTRREAFMRLCEYYFKKNKALETAIYASAAMEIPDHGFYANNNDHYTYKPHEYMYWSKWWLGDKEGSKTHYDKAFSYQPENPKFIHDRQFYYPEPEWPTVSFVIPTLGREEGLKKCVDSIRALDYPQHKIDISVLDGEGTVPEKVKRGVKNTKGEYIVYGANDVEFHSASLKNAISISKTIDKALIAFHEGPVSVDEGNINTHFVIRRNFISQLKNGEIFDTRYHHVGVDNFLWAQAKKLGQAFHCNEAIIVHNHFSKGAEYDEVYKKGWNPEKVSADRERLKQDLLLLNQS